jgi:hypothetical protein
VCTAVNSAAAWLRVGTFLVNVNIRIAHGRPECSQIIVTVFLIAVRFNVFCSVRSFIRLGFLMGLEFDSTS